MRPVFWTSTANIQSESVWETPVPPATVDYGVIERCFRVGVAKVSSSMPMKRGIEGAEGSRKRLRVLDDDNSKQLAIQFNRLPPPERLAAVLDTLDAFPDC